MTVLTRPREHVEWFVDPARYPIDWGAVFSWRTLLAVVAALVAVGVAYLAQRLLRDSYWPRLPFLQRMAIGAPTLLAVQAAIPLIYSGVQPVLLAPQLRLGSNLGGLVLGAVEALIGFSFLTGIWDRIAGAALVALVLIGFLLFSPLDMLSEMHWAGIAIVIFAIGRQAPEAGRPRRTGGWWRFQPPPNKAVVWLRILTGIAIMAPALAEKVWNARIGEAFIHQHPAFNFPHTFFGMTWVSDDMFVLAAGIVEFAIGALLVSGLLTRVVIIAMWLPFNITIPFLPPQELLWHLPFLGIMYFLLVHGADLSPDSDRVGAVGAPATEEDARTRRR
ncbi:MAG: hypothetical protein NVS1B3_07660 [Candidatus Dormibacteraceae bacterium]